MGVLVGVETEVGMETGVGGRIIMASNSGTTETETETGIGGMEVALNLVLQTQIQDTTPTIRDTIITTNKV